MDAIAALAAFRREHLAPDRPLPTLDERRLDFLRMPDSELVQHHLAMKELRAQLSPGVTAEDA
jgi:hypothetical protein